MPKRHTMKDVDHCSPFADELTSIWHRGGEGRTEDESEAAGPDGSDPVETVADD
jgi:hypothetical protein